MGHISDVANIADMAVGGRPVTRSTEHSSASSITISSIWRTPAAKASHGLRSTVDRLRRRDPDGSACVSSCLQKLGDDWRVLHDIPESGSSDAVDQLLVGPHGVFVVKAIHRDSTAVWLGGDVMIVNGQRVNHLRRCRQAADRVSKLLSAAVGFPVPVLSLVVIVGDRKLDGRHQSSDSATYVATPRSAVRWVRDRDVDWTTWGVQRIYDAAQRPATWNHEAAVATTKRPDATSDSVLDIPVAS